MEMKFRYLVVLILMAITAFAVNELKHNYTPEDNSGLDDLQSIPLQIGNFWQGQDFPLEEMVYEILETRAIIHRAFTGPQNENVFLSVVHYADTKVDFHAPEACLGGQGLKTTKTNKKVHIQFGGQDTVIDVAEVLTNKDSSKTLTYYFYKTGNFIGSNYIKMRLSIAGNKLFKNDTSGSLVRLSTSIPPSGEIAKAESTLARFLQNFYPYVKEL